MALEKTHTPIHHSSADPDLVDLMAQAEGSVAWYWEASDLVVTRVGSWDVLAPGAPGPHRLLSLLELLSPGERAGVEDTIRTLAEDGIGEETLTVVTASGSEVGIWLSGKPKRCLGVIRNTDPHAALEGARKSALEAAHEGKKARSDFLAMMSHEMRTPLNGIIGMNDMLLDSPLQSEQREWAEVVRSCGEGLLALINQVLDLAKAGSGTMTFEMAPFCQGEICEEVTAVIKETPAAQGLRVQLHMDERLPPRVLGDQGRFRQVLFNLVGNAVKFTDQGHVRIVIERLPVTVDGDRVMLRLMVEDTGIGMDEEARQRIFDPFHQESQSSTSRYAGTGLGLSITKRIINAQGGSLGVDSTPGQGTTFTADIPYMLASEESTAQVSAQIMQGHKAALVVEDVALRRLAQQMLAVWGVEVKLFESLPVFQEFHEINPTWTECVVINVTSGDRDMAIALEAFRNNAKNTNVPIVGLSTVLSSGYEERIRRLNVSLVFLPLRHSRFCSAMLRVFRDMGREITSGALRRSHILLVDDDSVARRVGGAMLGKLGIRVQTAASGTEALDLLSRKNYDLVFMDCLMPGMNGFETVAAIRKEIQGPKATIPVVALTAQAMDGDREACLAAGMDDYITKPVRPDDLRRMLVRWL